MDTVPLAGTSLTTLKNKLVGMARNKPFQRNSIVGAHIFLIVSSMAVTALSASVAACHMPSASCPGIYRTRGRQAIGPLGFAVHSLYHVLHICMRECGAFSVYHRVGQAIIWSLHFLFTAATGLLGIVAAQLRGTDRDHCCVNRHDNACSWPINSGKNTSLNAAEGHGSQLAENLYWAVLATSIAGLVTALLLLLYKDCRAALFGMAVRPTVGVAGCISRARADRP